VPAERRGHARAYYLKTAPSPEVRIIYDISRGDEGAEAEGGAAAGSCSLLFVACWLIYTASQLARAAFQSTIGCMGSHEGPSRLNLNQRLGTIHGGAGEARGAGGWVPALVPDPPGHRNTYSLAPALHPVICLVQLACRASVPSTTCLAASLLSSIRAEPGRRDCLPTAAPFSTLK
jgi:hypothetical protein